MGDKGELVENILKTLENVEKTDQGVRVMYLELTTAVNVITKFYLRSDSNGTFLHSGNNLSDEDKIPLADLTMELLYQVHSHSRLWFRGVRSLADFIVHEDEVEDRFVPNSVLRKVDKELTIFSLGLIELPDRKLSVELKSASGEYAAATMFDPLNPESISIAISDLNTLAEYVNTITRTLKTLQDEIEEGDVGNEQA